jgi:protein-S-isoprenylcysteine O-methyltransferase Ste14
MLKHILYSRTSAGEWHPVFGVLSQFMGGAVVYIAMVLAPAVLLWSSLRETRKSGVHAGTRRQLVLLGVGAWVVFALWSLPHSQPRGTTAYRVYQAVATVGSIAWLASGCLVAARARRQRGRR